MSKLLVFYLFTLSLAHFGFFGPARYVLIAVALSLILLVHKRVFVSSSSAYNVGGVVLISAGLIASLLAGSLFSLSYVLFMAINFVIYPGFAQVRIKSWHLGLLAMYLTFTLFFISPNSGGQATTLYGNPNNYATVAICTSYFTLLLFRRKLLWQLLSAPVFLTFIFFSASRTQLAAVLLFYGLYFSQRYVLRTHLRRLTVVGLLIMAGLYFTLIAGDQFDIIGIVQELTVGHKSYRGLSYRDVLFYASLDILDKFPYGVGWGLSGDYIAIETGELLSPHNTFMKVAVEGGWAALVGYLIVLLGMLWRTRSILVSSFFVAICIRSLFESSTPFTLSFVSAMLVVPFFLNERSLEPSSTRVRLPIANSVR